MNITKQYSFVLLVLTLSLLFSCREPLISSGDENKEQLIQGSWMFRSAAGSIFLTFKPDLTVDIVNSLDTNVLTFKFRIEDGDLYLSLVDYDQEVEFVYTIETLTPDRLVLSFVDDSGILTKQTYTRP